MRLDFLDFASTGTYQISDRELNVENAANMMISTFKWRDEFNTDALVSEEFPQDVFGPVGHVFGKDKEGRPVTYVPRACYL